MSQAKMNVSACVEQGGLMGYYCKPTLSLSSFKFILWDQSCLLLDKIRAIHHSTHRVHEQKYFNE